MRVNAVGWAFDSLEKVQLEAQKTAECTHNHRYGIKGAMAVASVIFLLRKGATKEDIHQYITDNFYELPNYTETQPTYRFDESCEGTVPISISCYLESDSYEDAVRKAIALGGDADTLGCIVGAIAEADSSYQIPLEWKEAVLKVLPAPLKAIYEDFCKEYHTK